MTTPRALPTLCWWIDVKDCFDGELTHHETRADAVRHHADQVRAEHGWVLTDVGAFAIQGGRPRQELMRCYVVACPECDQEHHVQTCFTACKACGYEHTVSQIPHVHPSQLGLFEPPGTPTGVQVRGTVVRRE